MKVGFIGLGTMGSASDAQGLAMIRLDRAVEAIDEGIDILAEGRRLTPRIQDWATFSWPRAAVA